jgi:hypothetical protein
MGERFNFDNRSSMIKYFASTVKNPKILSLGVISTDFINKMLKNLKSSKIEVVDLFKGTIKLNDLYENNSECLDMEAEYLKLVDKYTSVNNVQLSRSDYNSFLKLKNNETFDIIYTNYLHIENVRNDNKVLDYFRENLKLCYDKVKNNGCIMGYGYEIGGSKTKNGNVKKIVDEFCVEHKQSIISKSMDKYISFCIKVKK